MMTAPRIFTALMLGLCLGGCGDREEDAELPTEIVLQRATAYRQACAAKELGQKATENLELLESLALEGDTTSGARNAAAGFARAYQRHAEFRAAMYSMADSALNHAASSADSLRYEELADAFVVRAPAAGTVEANVMDAYDQDFSRILTDDDHPCNWNIPNLADQP